MEFETIWKISHAQGFVILMFRKKQKKKEKILEVKGTDGFGLVRRFILFKDNNDMTCE